MAPQRNKKNNNETSGRTAIIAVAVFLIVAVLVGNQYQGLMTNGSDQRTTDTLITSEFLQAVEQDRVECCLRCRQLYGHGHVLPRGNGGFCGA